jgi:hypothetical protein
MSSNANQNRRNQLLFQDAIDSSSGSDASPTHSERMEQDLSDVPPTRPTIASATMGAPIQQSDHTAESSALPPTRPLILQATASAPIQQVERAVEDDGLQPPAYTLTGRAPAYALIDQHRVATLAPGHPTLQAGPSTNPPNANTFTANMVPPQVNLEDVFLRLQQGFARLGTETDKLQAMKNQAAAADADRGARLAHSAEDAMINMRALAGQRMALQADRVAFQAEKTRLADEDVRVERDREVVAAQYAAALEIEKDNRKLESDLMQLAGKMEEREKALQDKAKTLSEKEKAQSSSSSSTTAQPARDPPSRGLAHNFPLTVELNTLPGIHSDATPTTPRMPSTGTQTLRRRSTVVHRTSLTDLRLWEPATVDDHGEATENSITGKSPVQQADDETVNDAEACELRHTSSERRDRQRSRSIRRVSPVQSLRQLSRSEGAFF